MTASSRAKTTPSSTAGSFAPSSGPRSRVQPDDGLSGASSIVGLLADYEARSRENRPDWAEFIVEAREDPTAIAFEVEEFSRDFAGLVDGGDGGDGGFDRLRGHVCAWLDGLTAPARPDRFAGLNAEVAAGRATVRSTVVPSALLTWPDGFEAEPGSCTLNASELDGHCVTDGDGGVHQLAYEEGFAHDGDGDWTAHAWLADQHGHVIDPTWDDAGAGFVYAVADDPFGRG